jgi:hypothetical protein
MASDEVETPIAALPQVCGGNAGLAARSGAAAATVGCGTDAPTRGRGDRARRRPSAARGTIGRRRPGAGGARRAAMRPPRRRPGTPNLCHTAAAAQVLERLTERCLVADKVAAALGEPPSGLRDVFELCRGFERAFTAIVNVRRPRWRREGVLQQLAAPSSKSGP